MSSKAIIASNLGKLYRIGVQKAGYRTLRDSIARIPGAPLRFAKSMFGRNGYTKPAHNTFWALKDVTFEVQSGEVIGVIGRNGAGKSTLLKILSRITDPTSGYAEIRGRVGSLLEVGTGFHPELTGRENILLNGAILGMSKVDIARRFDEMVSFAEVEKFIDTPVKHYSSGMYLRLAFAVAAHLETDILLVDEVLAVGDMQFQKKCLGKMSDVASAGRTVVFVSHNMSAVKSLCSKALLLKSGQIGFEGDVKEAVDKYLTDGSTIHETGVIDDSFTRQFGTGEARFRKVELTTSDGIPTKQFYFRQHITVGMEFEVKQQVPDANISVGITTADGMMVVYSETLDIDGSTLTLTEGHHCIGVEIPASLLPGNYSIQLGLGHLNGKTIDWIERVCDFTVLKVSLEKDRHYRWSSSHGFIAMEATWHLPEHITK
ncbi:MAG: ABC transporter ATP-binding protein [Bacteroidetes bacterium]|nr:ABC transporter ATP-binding protein [Bacteroidota bacterium]MCW5897435.1 ABC transporter ATP-binding protein [Bacteroidota bacterium]